MSTATWEKAGRQEDRQAGRQADKQADSWDNLY